MREKFKKYVHCYLAGYLGLVLGYAWAFYHFRILT